MKETLNIGVIGTSGRGTGMMKNLLMMDDVNGMSAIRRTVLRHLRYKYIILSNRMEGELIIFVIVCQICKLRGQLI